MVKLKEFSPDDQYSGQQHDVSRPPGGQAGHMRFESAGKDQ